MSSNLKLAITLSLGPVDGEGDPPPYTEACLASVSPSSVVRFFSDRVCWKGLVSYFLPKHFWGVRISGGVWFDSFSAVRLSQNETILVAVVTGLESHPIGAAGYPRDNGTKVEGWGSVLMHIRGA